MQVLHEYLILFTVKYFSNASTRLVEIVLTLGLLTPHSIVIYQFIYPQNSTGDLTEYWLVDTEKKIYIFNLQQQK